MKKVLLGLLAVLVVAGIAGYLFREPLMQTVMNSVTADMFVDADSDAFDPGLAVGAHMPLIAARYQGTTVNGLAQFMGENGVVLFAVRSVDW